MINEWGLNIVTTIGCVMTVISFLMAMVNTYLNYKRRKDIVKKYRTELQKQLMELKKMKENIEFEEKEFKDEEKYNEIKILIDNLIKQYENIS
jgi:heme/copper-type cytochrome/quinol oxidase subunit 1